MQVIKASQILKFWTNNNLGYLNQEDQLEQLPLSTKWIPSKVWVLFRVKLDNYLLEEKVMEIQNLIKEVKEVLGQVKVVGMGLDQELPKKGQLVQTHRDSLVKEV